MERWGGLENLKNASDRAKKIIHNLKLSVAAKVCNTSYCDYFISITIS